MATSIFWSFLFCNKNTLRLRERVCETVVLETSNLKQKMRMALAFDGTSLKGEMEVKKNE